MRIVINNNLEKLNIKKENELKSIIENFVNRKVGNCKKIEIFYSYRYDPLNREIKGEIICDEKRFKFKCGEFLENFIIKGGDFNHMKEEDKKYFLENGCSKEFIKILEKFYNMNNEKIMYEFINDIQEYKNKKNIHPFEKEVIEILEGNFYFIDFSKTTKGIQ